MNYLIITDIHANVDAFQAINESFHKLPVP
jgi:hypothetical protein